ncbi:hypothetical protein JKP88DRAFT_277170 [Tribonema minus]|uniref:HECT domain-containing protein n=1 Tax=Tribonema minus TaxID=303371 RepID=A0A836CGI2_9STRA|nr:hypothetical protein JKP88DRAFT_277170 [Tribonema minus]
MQLGIRTSVQLGIRTSDGAVSILPDRLPEASTCFNELRVPSYTSLAALQEAMSTAMAAIFTFNVQPAAALPDPGGIFASLVQQIRDLYLSGNLEGNTAARLDPLEGELLAPLVEQIRGFHPSVPLEGDAAARGEGGELLQLQGAGELLQLQAAGHAHDADGQAQVQVRHG